MLLLLLFSVTTSQVAAVSCPSANTLVKGQDDSTAIVYDDACNPRSFQVLASLSVERSLNLSNLNVAEVESYPRVYHLYDQSL